MPVAAASRPATAPRRRRAFLAAVLALAAAGACGGPQLPPPVAYVIPVRSYTFASGLRVIVEQEDTAPLVGVVWVVEAGHADDPPGRPGLAHAVEHLAFRAKDGDGVSVEERLIRLGGAGINAETDLTTTTYYAFAPRAALDQLMAIELAQMADPLRGVDEASIAGELSVIGQEMDVRAGMAARAGARLVLKALFPPGHPILASSNAARGTLHGLTRAELRAFTSGLYRPERMTLVISGAVPPEWDRRFTKLLPAWLDRSDTPDGVVRPPVRRQLLPKHVPPAEPGARIESGSGPVTKREIWIAWVLPPARSGEQTPLALLTSVAGFVLEGALQGDRLPGVVSVDTNLVTGPLGSALMCRAELEGQADPAKSRDLIVNVVGSLARLGAGDHGRALQRVLKGVALAMALATESLAFRARSRAALVHDSPDAKLGDNLRAVSHATSAGLGALASRYLTAAASRAVLMVPEAGRAARPPPPPRAPAAQLLVAPGAPVAPGDAAAAHDDGTDPASTASAEEIAKLAAAPGAAAATVARLSNGLTVIALPRRGLPFVTTLLGFHADPAPDDAPGARVAAMLARYENLQFGALDRGIYRQIERDQDSVREVLHVFSTDFNGVLDYIAEDNETLTLRWTPEQIHRRAGHFATDEATRPVRAERAFAAALWGKHPYAVEAVVTGKTIRRISAAEVDAWFHRVRRPANGVLVVVGDVDPQAVVRRAESRLGGWTGDPAPPPPPPPPAAPSGVVLVAASSGTASDRPRVLVQDAPGREAASLRFGCHLPPIRAARDDTVGRLLSEMIERDLRRRLRVEAGVTYTPSVRAVELRGGSGLIAGELDSETARVADAVTALRRWLDPRAPVPYDRRTIEAIRFRLARVSTLGTSTNSQLAHQIFDAWNMGWSPAALDDFPRDLASITAGEIEAALATCRATAVISVVGDGAGARIEPTPGPAP